MAGCILIERKMRYLLDTRLLKEVGYLSVFFFYVCLLVVR